MRHYIVTRSKTYLAVIIIKYSTIIVNCCVDPVKIISRCNFLKIYELA